MRKYTGVGQFFHNHEHSPEGRTHCTGPLSNPYRIEHVAGKHKISHPYAKGHGRGGVSQWFRFPEKLGDGYDLSSGIRIAKPPTPNLRSRTLRTKEPWQPWQMTQKEYIATGTQRAQREAGHRGLKSNHYAYVEGALSQGKPVPLDVLKDYPDLARRYPFATEGKTKGRKLRERSLFKSR